MKNKTPQHSIDNTKLSRNVRKAQKGSQKAFEEIVNDTKDYIYFYCLSLLKNENDAIDAVQDIYIILFKKLDTIENPKAFLGWLKVVSSNYCKNKLARSHSTDSLDESIVEDEACPQLTPEKSVETDELCSIINSEIEKLPDFQRECVLMYYYQQMSIAEISVALGLKDGTVKSRLFNARKALKAGLERYGKDIISLGAISPMSYITYALNEASKNVKMKSSVDLTVATPKGAVDSATMLAYSSSTAATLKSFGALKVASIAVAGALAIGGVTAHVAFNKASGANDTAAVESVSVRKKPALKSVKEAEAKDRIIDLAKEAEAKDRIIDLAISKIQRDKDIQFDGINRTSGFDKADEFTKNIDFKALPVQAEKIGKSKWVVVFTNGQHDVVSKYTGSNKLHFTQASIDAGYVWKKDGTWYIKIPYEAYYYMIELDEKTGDMINYGAFHSTRPSGEVDDYFDGADAYGKIGGMSDRKIDKVLENIYHKNFDVKYVK